MEYTLPSPKKLANLSFCMAVYLKKIRFFSYSQDKKPRKALNNGASGGNEERGGNSGSVNKLLRNMGSYGTELNKSGSRTLVDVCASRFGVPKLTFLFEFFSVSIAPISRLVSIFVSTSLPAMQRDFCKLLHRRKR